MTAEQYARICELFEKAVALPPAERSAFLKKACDGDEFVRVEVEKMLAGDDSHSSLDETPVGPSPLLLNVKALMPDGRMVRDWVGQRVGAYQIVRKLGTGGMGAVFLASRLDDFEQQVAIKLIRAGLDTEQLIARFRLERQVLANLNHPHIARLLDGGTTEDGLPYFVMEYIDGQPFDRYCNRLQLPMAERVKLLKQVAEAVQYAHQRMVLHRDLKPSNILVTADGVPKIVDFGLAKHVQAWERESAKASERESGVAADEAPTLPPRALTQSGAIIGTPSYMAPEQAGGGDAEIGPRVDVYALGAILYEMLTGKPPFHANTPLETVIQVISDDPVPPSQLNPRLSRDLETICLKCLEKEPARRYQSASEVADELGRFLNGEPIRARPISRLERTWRWCRRHPAVATLTAAIGVLLLTVTVSAVAFARHERGLRQEADEERTKAERAAHELGITVSERELHNRDDVALAEDFLERCPPERRAWEWHYLRRKLDGDAPVLRGHTKGVWGVAFSPDSRLLASCSIDETVLIWDVESRKVLYTFGGHQFENQLARATGRVERNAVIPVMCVAFSPDGKYVASGSGAAVKIWDPLTGKQLHTYRGQKHLMLGLAWSPDGEWIVSTNWDLSVHLWSAKTNELRHELKGHTDWVNRPAFSPDGKLLATPSMDATTKLWNPATGKEVATLREHLGPVRDAEFSRDGKWLATGGMDGLVVIWDVATRQPIRKFTGHSGVLGLAFKPDGERLATTGFDRKVKLWDPATGKDVLTLRGHTDTPWSVAFSPDGHRLASASFDGTVRVWDATPRADDPPPNYLTPVGHQERVNQVVFSPDGSKLASSSWDNTARIWDSRTGQLLTTLQGHTGMVWGVAFSPEAKRVATASWDRTAKVWDLATGQPLFTLVGHKTVVHSVAFSPDGTQIATSCVDGEVKLWNAGDGKEQFTLTAHLPLAYSVVFTPDGQRLVTGGGDRMVKVFDLKTRKMIHTLAGHTAVVYSVAISPDGTKIASASWDKTIRIWDAVNGKELYKLEGHTDRVFCVGFSADGKRLLSGAEDKSVRTWDVETAEEVQAPVIHRGPVWGVAASRDGRWASAAWYLPAGIRIGSMGQ